MAGPKYKVGDYMKVYCGQYEGHHFYIKEVRFNKKTDSYEYLYDGILMGGWYHENAIVQASDRRGWHYDSQGYCDNPGRGY